VRYINRSYLGGYFVEPSPQVVECGREVRCYGQRVLESSQSVGTESQHQVRLVTDGRQPGTDVVSLRTGRLLQQPTTSTDRITDRLATPDQIIVERLPQPTDFLLF